MIQIVAILIKLAIRLVEVFVFVLLLVLPREEAAVIVAEGCEVAKLLRGTAGCVFFLSRYAGRGQGEGSVSKPRDLVFAGEPSPQPSPGVPGEGVRRCAHTTI